LARPWEPPVIWGERVGGPGERRGLVLVDITLHAVEDSERTGEGRTTAAAAACLSEDGGVCMVVFASCRILDGFTLYWIVVPDGIVIVCGRA
jgi:hypothetical protein